MPKPASETARVVSSFGINRIEAFDVDGKQLQDIRISYGSLSVFLDVRR